MHVPDGRLAVGESQVAFSLGKATASIAAILVACVGIPGCGQESIDGAQTELPIADAVPPETGCRGEGKTSTDRPLNINEITRYPCDLVAVPTGIEFGPAEDGSRPDPLAVGGYGADGIAVDARGRFFTGARHESMVLVWDSAGQYLGSIGRKGEGPGEFLGRIETLLIGPNDTLYVKEGTRWHVFDPDQRFVRTFLSNPTFGASIHITEDNRIVITGPSAGGGSGSALTLLDAEGNPMGGFGFPREDLPLDALGPRRSAYRAGSLWIGPAWGSSQGFLIEHRDLDGELLDVIRRQTPWLPLSGYREPELRMVAPDFKYIDIDLEGLLWVALVVKDPRWTPLKPGEHPDERETERADFRLEVIDTEAATVLAAVRLDDVREDEIPPLFPVGRGTHLRFARHTDSLGLFTYRIYQVFLLPTSARDTTNR